MSNNSISHALEDYLKNRQSLDTGSAGLIVEVETNYNFLIIRGSSKDNEFLMHAEELFGQSLPLDFNIFNVGEHVMYWMSPNEWLVASQSDIKELIKEVDYAFLDGTFYQNGELGRDMSDIPHPFVKESMNLFSSLSAIDKRKIHFIHFNHTNPLLIKNSNQQNDVRNKGFKIAKLQMS